MEYLKITSLASLVQALLTGLVMGIYYDVFRFLRRIFKFSAFSVAVQDMLFWISSAVAVFFVCVRLNGGFVRVYFVILALTGWWVYYQTAGKFIFILFDAVIKFFGRILDTIKHFLIKLFEIIYQKLET